MTSDGEDASRWDKDSKQIAPGRSCTQTTMDELYGVFAHFDSEVSCPIGFHLANFHVVNQYAIWNGGINELAITDYTKNR